MKEKKDERFLTVGGLKAHWIIDFHGFAGTYYKCSECGASFWDVMEEVDSEGPCPNCGVLMNEDEHVYMKNGKIER